MTARNFDANMTRKMSRTRLRHQLDLFPCAATGAYHPTFTRKLRRTRRTGRVWVCILNCVVIYPTTSPQQCHPTAPTASTQYLDPSIQVSTSLFLPSSCQEAKILVRILRFAVLHSAHRRCRHFIVQSPCHPHCICGGRAPYCWFDGRGNPSVAC